MANGLNIFQMLLVSKGCLSEQVQEQTWGEDSSSSFIWKTGFPVSWLQKIPEVFQDPRSIFQDQDVLIAVAVTVVYAQYCTSVLQNVQYTGVNHAHQSNMLAQVYTVNNGCNTRMYNIKLLLGPFYGAIAVPSVTRCRLVVVVVVDIGVRGSQWRMGPTFFKCFLLYMSFIKHKFRRTSNTPCRQFNSQWNS